MAEPPGSGKPSKRLTNTCHSCKVRHLKCDDSRAPCAACRKAKIECVRGYSVRFRHKLNPSVPVQRGLSKPDYSFSKDQRWVNTRRTLSFIDETEDTVSLYHCEESTAGAASTDSPPKQRPYSTNAVLSPLPSPPPGISTPTSLPVPSWVAHSVPRDLSTSGRSAEVESSFGRTRLGSDLSTNISSADVSCAPGTTLFCAEDPRILLFGGQDLEPGSSTSFLEQSIAVQDAHFRTSRQDVLSDVTRLQEDPQLAVADPPAQPSPPLYMDTPQWPLQDHQESMLFRHYVYVLAPMFDLCDQENRHFATVVARRAATCPLLLNALLAASAKRLSRIDDFDALAADKYHNTCIRLLLSALSNPLSVADENVLTAIVILRYIEELDAASSRQRPESHLMGIRVFIAAQEKTCDFSGLRMAAYGLALRQEIYTAFVHARSIHPSFTLKSIVDMAQNTENGCGYANRIIMHCAECLKFCYGSEEKNVAAWKELRAYQDRWWREKPWIFQPIWSDQSESGFFINEVYLNAPVVMGVQHYHLARMLLIAHDPSAPRLGPGLVHAFRAINEDIKKIVRLVCGIAESNPEVPPAYAYAFISISLAGDRFTERDEQEALYRILRKTDEELAWPTRSAQSSLREAWGWEDSLPHPDMSIAGILNSGPRPTIID